MSKFEKILLLTVVVLFGTGIVIGLVPRERTVAQDLSQRQQAVKATVQFPIELNSAGLQERKAIKGIGEVKAKLILEYRNTNGPYHSLDELLNVKGIGPKTLESLQAFIFIDEKLLFASPESDRSREASRPGQKIDINRATLEDLITLPGIGEAKGKQIIAYREVHGKFNEAEELIGVSGIGEKTLQAIMPLICCE